MTLKDEGLKGKSVDCHQIEEQQMIERYIDGTLPETDAEAFEEHYFGCQHCFSELQLRHAAAIELGSQSHSKTSGLAAKAKPFRVWALLVAAVLLLTVTGLWLVRQRNPIELTPSTAALQDPQEKLLQELTRIDEPPPYLQATIRGGVEGPAQVKFHQGMSFYQEGKYAEATPYLRAASELDPMLFPSRFYLGISLLMNNQNDEAIQPLLSLSETKENPYFEESNWYLAKAYFRKNDVKTGKDYLEVVAALKGAHFSQASNDLDRLEKIAKDSQKGGSSH